MAERKPVTLQKVADASGVSVSTVSRILSGAEFATPETRQRVIETARRMQYVPLRSTKLGRNLLKGTRAADDEDDRPSGIALLIPEPLMGPLHSCDWIYHDVIPTLQTVATRRNLHLVLVPQQADGLLNVDALQVDHISGAIWMMHGRDEQLASLARELPVVVINDDTHWPSQTSVMCSNRMVMFKAVEHLAQLGHHRIGFFGVNQAIPAYRSAHGEQRLASYHQAIEHHALNADPALVLTETFGHGEHPKAIASVLDRIQSMDNAPTAIITQLGYAVEFIKQAKQRSISIPDDLSIIAIDNAVVADLIEPALTTIDCLLGRCAEMAVDLLMDMHKTPRQPAKTILMEPALILRDSTAPPAH